MRESSWCWPWPLLQKYDLCLLFLSLLCFPSSAKIFVFQFYFEPSLVLTYTILMASFLSLAWMPALPFLPAFLCFNPWDQLGQATAFFFFFFCISSVLCHGMQPAKQTKDRFTQCEQAYSFSDNPSCFLPTPCSCPSGCTPFLLSALSDLHYTSLQVSLEFYKEPHLVSQSSISADLFAWI